jgi:hypothetical protein
VSYQRKTRDYWDIEQNCGYGDGWEVVCAEDTWKEAKAQLRCYRENQPEYPVRASKRREHIEQLTTAADLRNQWEPGDVPEVLS